MNEMPKVSVIVPVYNMGGKIRKSVESIIAQTYENLEIILVDDGSKDDSLEQCLELEKDYSRVKVYHTENRGSGPARNHGIENATGDYLYFPDADDYIEPDAIKILVSNALSTDADMVLCGYRDVDEKGKILYEKKYKQVLVSGEEIRNNYAYYKVTAPEFGLRGAPWNKLFKASVVHENNVAYPPLRRHQDEAFIGRYFCFCNSAIFISDVLYTYFTNDQKTEWEKYPVDYIDAVNGLYEERKQNVLIWNQNDKQTKDMVLKEYICNFIKALELSFSPKFSFNAKQRKAWMKKQVDRSAILSVEIPASLGLYQRIAMKLISNDSKMLLYWALGFKVTVFKIMNW